MKKSHGDIEQVLTAEKAKTLEARNDAIIIEMKNEEAEIEIEEIMKKNSNDEKR